MNDIITELSKPLWWFSVVIAGIIINLFSSYLRDFLDKSFSCSLAWWHKRSSSRMLAWKIRVENIRNNAHTKDMEFANELRHRLGAIQIFLLALSILLLPVLLAQLGRPLKINLIILYISFGFSSVISFLAFLEFIAAEICQKAIEEARSS